MRGIIEGFYGPPWSWEQRHFVCTELAGGGMDTYVYAPKDDPLHRERWREPYGEEFLGELEQLAGSDTLRIGFALSPGLSMDPDSEADRATLLAKLGAVVERGTTLVGLFFDDLTPAPGLGFRHGSLTAWLRTELPEEVELFMAPLHYTGVEDVPYLCELRDVLPEEVAVAWTGRHVVNDTITAADARAWSANMDGRLPWLWDNTPVNDVIMGDRLFPGPLSGRDADLPDHLAGYLANPMVQARASVPALLSAAGWLRGDDPVDVWEESIGDAAVFAEAVAPRHLAELCRRALAGDEAATEDLAVFFADAASCGDGGFGAEVEPWVTQVRTEAGVAQLALQAISADPEERRQALMVLLLMWPKVCRSEVSVFGGRGGARPMMSQDGASQWVPSPGCLLEPASVVDSLVAAAFARC